MPKKNNKTANEIEDLEIANKIRDIRTLLKAGVSNMIITLIITKKYHLAISEEFVKMIKSEYFVYNGADWIERTTGERVVLDMNIMEEQAKKILNWDDKSL